MSSRVDQYWTTFSRTNSVKVSKNLHHPKPRGGLLRCFNKTTTLSKLWFGGHQSRSPTTNFSNKISVQLLCLIAWRRESKICVSLVFFYIQSKKLLQEFGFHDCLPQRDSSLSQQSQKTTTTFTIYFWQLNDLNWITITIVCDPYFFLFLVFLIYYHIFWFFPQSLSTLNR